MVALTQERDSKVLRGPGAKGGACHRVRKQISRHAEDVEAVAHLEITFESSHTSAESTGMVASTCHRNGCPMSLELVFHNSIRAEECRNLSLANCYSPMIPQDRVGRRLPSYSRL